MTKYSKKKEELKTVQRYLEVAHLDGTASINPALNDAPDVFVDLGRYRIGVEVTRYDAKEKNASGYRRIEVEVAWKKMQANLLDLVEKEEPWLIDYDVILRFKNDLIPSKNDTHSFFDAIKEQISSNAQIITDKDFLFPFSESWPAMLKNYLMSFSAHKTPCKKAWDAENFLFKRLGTSDDELCEVVKNKIPRKESKRPVHENWLLIYGGAELPTMFDVPWLDEVKSFVKFNELLKKSNYDAVALLGFRKWLRWTNKNGWEEILTE